MTDNILETRNLLCRFGVLTATNQVSFDLRIGELHAVIGPNGAGKTTLLAQMSGELSPTSGDVILDGQSITDLTMPERVQKGIARSFQITSLCRDYSALQNVTLAVQANQGHSFRMWGRALDDRSLTVPAHELLAMVGLNDRAHTPAGLLAHGEQRQLEVAVALACRPRVLLLDEPMAGMGREESRRMMNLLRNLKGRVSMLLIEHDMDAVFALADRITVLVYGRAIATGLPREISASPDVRAAYLGQSKQHA
jgi:branched-chain amino acid transport system ATP-binding protein